MKPNSIGPTPGPPYQSQFPYRVATTAGATRRMLDALRPTEGEAGPLSRLDASARHDPVLGLIDAWACVVDGLSFYNERIANENYLRTATERRSVVELARLVGHRPRPGVAADTFLAYSIEKGHGEVVIPAGAQAQSVPRPGQTPQVYETAVPLVAHDALNAMPTNLTEPQQYAVAASPLGDYFVKGVVTVAKAGRPALVWAADGVCLVRTLVAVEPRPAENQTRLRFQVAADSPVNPPARRPRTLPERLVRWLNRELGVTEASLKGVNRLSERFVRELSRVQPHRRDELYAAIAAGDDAPAADAGLDAQPQHGIQVFQIAAGLFGNAASQYELLRPGEKGPPHLREAVAETDEKNFDNNVLSLDNIYDIPSGSPVVIAMPNGKMFVGRVREAKLVQRVDYDLGARVTELNIEWTKTFPRPASEQLGAELKGCTLADLRRVTVFAAPVQLEMTDRLRNDAVEGDTIELDGMFNNVEPGRTLVVAGAKVVRGSSAVTHTGEVATVSRVEIAYDPLRTVLRLREPLSGPYERSTVRVFGNVVVATHGETVRQVLGSGDGSASQTFPLRQGPLVYVSGSTETGSCSSLEVRVDGVRWHESTDRPADRSPVTRAYRVEQTPGGGRRVVFGDGVTAARVPSGVDNVTAVYRVGQGLAGNAEPGQISMALTRVLGVTSVINPLSAVGGANPEPREMIRRNAARSTTLLSRLVSESDYQHFAAAFAGVGKAKGRWLVLPEGRGLYLTVAGMTDEPLKPKGKTFLNLLQAFRQKGDPRLPVRLLPHRLANLRLTAALRVHADYQWDRVESAARAAVFTTFDYARRELEDDFDLSPLVACIQTIPGVLAVDVRRLTAFRTQTVPVKTIVRDRIAADRMRVDADGTPVGAEVLCFLPGLPESVEFYPWPSADPGEAT